MAYYTVIKPVDRRIGDCLVSVFQNTMTPDGGKLSLPEMGEIYRRDIKEPYIMTLREFLDLGRYYLKQIAEIRAIEDKRKRDDLKRKIVPCGSLSAQLKTRAKLIPDEQKIVRYNGIMVLDFDGIEDVETTKAELSKIPYFWYIGLSVSGRGLFGIVPIGGNDWTMHKIYFKALKEEMAERGFKVDESCSDVGRVRVISWDEHPFFNENCSVFCLEDDDEDEDSDSEGLDDADFPQDSNAITDNDRVKLYVEEWERKRIALDSYADWLAIGLSLSHEGEDGLAAFKRVSRFSSKYNEEEAEKKFRSFVSGNYSPGLGTFFYKCHQYGVIPESIPHYDCIPFPVEVFPKKIQEIIEQTNRHQNFPIDYIAPCLLFVASLACGNSAVVELQRGWREKPLMYLAIVGGRGTNKTSCFDFALDRFGNGTMTNTASMLRPRRFMMPSR